MLFPVQHATDCYCSFKLGVEQINLDFDLDDHPSNAQIGTKEMGSNVRLYSPDFRS